MASSERIRGSDSCSIQKFDGLPSKTNLVKEDKGITREKDLSVYPEKVSFQTSISIKEEI